MFLEISDLKKSFGEGDSKVQVLKGIDLSVDKGEICVLLVHPVPVNLHCSILLAALTHRIPVMCPSTGRRWWI